MKEKKPQRFLSIRLSPVELKAIYHHCKSSGCRSLTEYVKKVLTHKPVTIKIRNESLDAALLSLLSIKGSLERIDDYLADTTDTQLRREIATTQSLLLQLYDKWSRL